MQTQSYASAAFFGLSNVPKDILFPPMLIRACALPWRAGVTPLNLQAQPQDKPSKWHASIRKGTGCSIAPFLLNRQRDGVVDPDVEELPWPLRQEQYAPVFLSCDPRIWQFHGRALLSQALVELANAGTIYLWSLDNAGDDYETRRVPFDSRYTSTSTLLGCSCPLAPTSDAALRLKID